ncbi:hypothetical protein L1O03_06540 [Corynebacterium uropygiale]|uniref:Uncharacterized protein n=1 Tax=Corynebacterium uropygiale TaxID=1775911 RepID=A0A9X1QPN0_9CORY|nr:hypothetical protein [Corynebacterium uropygiale]MCF4006836.1 hypothetical protein [Corynebacterium uropygiale]
MLDTVMVLAERAENVGPLGPEFGKASPVGLLVLVLLAAAVLYLGWAFHRRFSRMNRRRIFAEQNGLDLFDEEALDKAMEEAGVLDHRRKHLL